MIGKTVSHYKLLSKLGEGGMGVVYKALDTTLDRHVAVKFLPSQLSSDADAKTRFIREAKAASALNHANIAVVHEIDETPDGQMFMVMAFYEGRTLKERLKDEPLTVADAITIVSQLASGLAAAHEKGILHRDIKPGNILMGADGQAKLADFGLATLAGETKLTKTGTTVGTVAYMSPEQARGEELDSSSDIFSLGAVLYELLTGRTPFPGDHEAAVLYGILHSDPAPLEAHADAVPEGLQGLMDKSLKKEVGDRFASAREFQHSLDELRDSLRGSGSNAMPKSRRRARSSRLRNAGFAVLFVVAATAAVLFFLRPRPTKAIESIAVLPLDDLSPEPAEEYFTEGMTEALILNLSKIRGLRVTSRTSVMSFKNTTEPVSEIARKLGVDGVVEGSVLCVGDRVQITAQLIDASSDATLWGESFESEARDILQLQRQVAREVARGIELKLSPQEEVSLAATDAIDPKAHEAYLRARYLWNRRSGESVPKSIELFEEALEIEPRFADAWAGLAEAYVILQSYAPVSVLESAPKARECANRALEIDSTSAAAYNVLADVAYIYDLDWEESEKLRRHALSLNPSYATAHQWYAEFLSGMGRHDEALSEIHMAQRLDPLSLIMKVVEGGILFNARRYEEAVEIGNQILERDPSFEPVLGLLAIAYNGMGDLQKSLEWQIRILTSMGESEADIEAFRAGFAKSGRAGLARARLEWLKKKEKTEYVKPRRFAATYAQLGEKDEAMRCLERSYQERDIAILKPKVNPVFDSMREDPRFQALMKRLRLDS